jgi:GTP:adenosylcobinamide-phosphate guanylyltransferase
MNAIVTAGGASQPGEPLYEVTHGGFKSMLAIAGKPMVQWVLDALGESTQIERVVVVGLSPETDLQCRQPLVLAPDYGDVILNIRAGAQELARLDPAATHALIVSGDLPALRGEIVDWLVNETRDRDFDLCYTVIERATMEKQFPGSKRTYVKLKDCEVCGGDLHVFRLAMASDESPLWKRLIDARKSPIRQASLLGYDTVLYLVLRRLSLKNAEAMLSKRLGIAGRALLSPYAEIGMDVDKPFQLEIAQAHLSSRLEKHAPRPG